MQIETKIDQELLSALKEINSSESDIKGVLAFCDTQDKRHKLLEYIKGGQRERKEIIIMSSQIALGQADKKKKYSMSFFIEENNDLQTGDFTEKRGNLINDLELIVRHNIEGNADRSIFRNPSTSKKSILGLIYTKVNAPLYIGKALIEILDYLEKNYSLNFDV